MDRGIRPYASSAKTYNEMLDEETEQNYRSRNFVINPSLKQPYMFKDYTEMMYLYSGGQQKKDLKINDVNIIPTILATVTSPDYAFFDYFVEEGEVAPTYTVLFDEEFTDLSAWFVYETAPTCINEISPAGEYHGNGIQTDVYPAAGGINDFFTSTPIPTYYGFETEFKIDSMNNDTGTFIGVGTYDSSTSSLVSILFRMDGIYLYDGSTYTQIGTVIPSTGIYQNWKVILTITGATTFSCEVFLKSGSSWVSQGSENLSYALNSPLGFWAVSYETTSSVTALDFHMKNIKLYYE